MQRIDARVWPTSRPTWWAVLPAGLTRARRHVRWSGGWTPARERRLACALLGLWTALVVLAAIVPQQGITPPIEYGRWREQAAPASRWLEAAGFTAAPRAPWLPLAGALVAVGLAVYGARQIGAVRLHLRASRLTPAALARLGSALFHVALLAAGAAVALSGLTRVAGHVELAAGAGVVDRPDRYQALQAGPWPLPPTGLTVRLDELILATWPDGSLKEHRAAVSVLRDGQPVRRQELRRGQALDVDEISIVLGARTGPAVLLTAEDALGRRFGWVHLPEWPGDGESAVSLAIPGTTTHVALALTAARPGQTRDAVLNVRPFDPVDRVAAWQIRPGESAAIGPTRLTFAAVDAWSAVTVTRDPFANWAFAASGLGAIGLALATVLSTPGRSAR